VSSNINWKTLRRSQKAVGADESPSTQKSSKVEDGDDAMNTHVHTLLVLNFL